MPDDLQIGDTGGVASGELIAWLDLLDEPAEGYPGRTMTSESYPADDEDGDE